MKLIGFALAYFYFSLLRQLLEEFLTPLNRKYSESITQRKDAIVGCFF